MLCESRWEELYKNKATLESLTVYPIIELGFTGRNYKRDISNVIASHLDVYFHRLELFLPELSIAHQDHFSKASAGPGNSAFGAMILSYETTF